MPIVETVDAFVGLVVSSKFIEAMERFYDADATAQENLDPPRVGLPALLANERKTLAAFKHARARLLEPALIAGDRVALHWEFVFEHASGKTIRLEEVALQTWRGEKMIGEQFFYDPRQLGK